MPGFGIPEELGSQTCHFSRHRATDRLECAHSFLLKNIYIRAYIFFLYFFLFGCARSLLSFRLSLVWASRGYPVVMGFSLGWLLSWIKGSRAHNLQELQLMGSVVAVRAF